MDKRIIIAIDGPAGAGKSTIARRVAAKLGFIYIDTGAMYRAVALWALRAGIALDDLHRLGALAEASEIRFEAGAQSVLLNGEDVTAAIRAPEVSAAASKISAAGVVRRVLVGKQREMAAESSVVMEGRDIGTVVFPEAQVKIFLDADTSVRAGRRALETGADPEAVEREIRERDARDRDRAEAPMSQAPDAVYLDSGGLSLEDVEQVILKIVRERTSNGKGYR